MVQRKASIQPSDHHHVKTERKVMNLKITLPDRGAELKKIKMKKSGPISLRSPSSRRHVNQPGRPPPPLPLPPPTETKTPPQNRSDSRATTTTPNYMKSTSSSNARKEKAQVSAKSTQTSPDCSSLRRKSSNSSQMISDKATKTLARTTSLKMMRTPSFKPIKKLTRKCSPVALCEDLEVQRATCSSTLKESKFPAYLTLSPGGTELEGTSAMKVCPYTYCSLNGHRHASLPPLKHFMSARRRTLKTQRNVKLGCLSPRRARPMVNSLNFDEELSDQQDLTLGFPTQEEQNDFFVEVYVPNKEDTDEYARGLLVETRDEPAAEDHEEHLLETLSEGTAWDEIDTNQSIDHDEDLNPTDTLRTMHSHEENQEDGKALAQEETETTPSAQLVEQDSDASDMDWETGDYPALYLDDEYEYASEHEREPDMEGGKAEKCLVEEEFVSKLDEEIKTFFEEFLAEEISDGSYDEESSSSDMWSGSDDCESVSSDDYQENLYNLKTEVPSIVPEEKPEAAPQGTGEEETSCDNLLDEYSPNDDSTAKMVDQASETQTSADEGCQVQTEVYLSDEDQTCNTDKEDSLTNECNQEANLETSTPMDLGKVPYSKVGKSAANPETGDSYLILTMGKGKKPIEDSDELGEFNPRAPNFLPLEPKPESEKVDLRHQEMDDKKNSDEWMIDYALRETVSKLSAARKRKVALLVEAFEKVTPATKYENQVRQNSAFHQGSTIQACR